MDNLKKCALHGPVMKFMAEGVRVTYQWTDEDDMASPDLIQMLEGLDLGATDSRCAELDQLLSANRRKNKEYDSFISDGSGGGEPKEDVFEKIGHLVPKLPTALVPIDDIRIDLSPPEAIEYPNRTVVTREVFFSYPLVRGGD
ncbi:hypothetical protein CLAIMM_13705 [Cladophialophora immunda]|nr:hypothetical protein CLAIMM_13705 [Cladophialophora immunda]